MRGGVVWCGVQSLHMISLTAIIYDQWWLACPTEVADSTNRRRPKGGAGTKELKRLAPDVAANRTRAFAYFLLTECHGFVAGKIEDLMMNPSVLQQSQQVSLC